MQTLNLLNRYFSEKVFYKNCYDDIVKFLNHNRIPYLAGTKRIVIDHPGDKNKVIKIAYKKAGVDDNTFDIIVSSYIGTYSGIDPILKSNIAKSTLAQVGSAFMIVCDKITIAKDFQPLKNFVKNNMDTSKGINMRKAIIRYIESDSDLTQQYNDLRQAIRSCHIIASDVDIISEPANYGFRLDGNRVVLVLCDIGSCIPRFRNVEPKCPKCGSDLKPVIKRFERGADLESRIATDEMYSQRGKYTCTNMTCSNNYDRNTSSDSVFSNLSADERLSIEADANYAELVDTEVFNRYVTEMFDDIRKHKVYMIGVYSPQRPVANIDEYANQLRNDFPDAYNKIASTNSGDKPLMVYMYENYVMQMNSARAAQSGVDVMNYFNNNPGIFGSGFLNIEAFVDRLIGSFKSSVGENDISVGGFIDKYGLDQTIADAYLQYIYNNAPKMKSLDLRNGHVVYDQLSNMGVGNISNRTIEYIIKGYNNTL